MLCSKVWRFFTDYIENCTIQGVKYIGEKNRHWIEKLFWIVAITCCFITCSFLIYEIYKKWLQDPLLVTFADSAIPISDIPFPAVTICPLTRIDKEKLNFTEICHKLLHNKSESLTQEKLKSFESAVHVCSESNLPFLQKLKNDSKLHSNEIVKEILKISSLDYLKKCIWRKRIKKCNNLFSATLTSQGICFTFNMIGQPEMMKQEM